MPTTTDYDALSKKSVPANPVSKNGDVELLDHIQRLRESRQRLKEEISKVIVGQHDVIDLLLLGLLCRGHVLLHGVPGLGKTLMARTLSQALDLRSTFTAGSGPGGGPRAHAAPRRAS